MDYAGLQLKKSKRNTPSSINLRNDSLQHFLEAYYIFEKYFEPDQNNDALQKAEAAIQIAELLEEDNCLLEAKPMA